MLSVVWRTSDQGLLLIPDCLLKSKQSSCWREKIWIYMQESPKPWPWQRVNWWTFYTDFLLLTSLLFSPSLSPPLNIFIPASFPVQHHLVSRATPHISTPPRPRSSSSFQTIFDWHVFINSPLTPPHDPLFFLQAPGRENVGNESVIVFQFPILE